MTTAVHIPPSYMILLTYQGSPLTMNTDEVSSGFCVGSTGYFVQLVITTFQHCTFCGSTEYVCLLVFEGYMPVRVYQSAFFLGTCCLTKVMTI